MSDADSPCIRICTIDPASRLCRGCLRSLDEIAIWSRLGATERRAIMQKLPARAARLAPDGVPLKGSA
ncbi:MAG: DUF1289 domain-containing protein [Rhodobacteraceae bacterium]|nr:DUF1289 domain-containing protein [Paracoccaceae bacterium]